MLGLALASPLTACRSWIVANDPKNECDHPAKPAKPYDDAGVGLYITAQGQAIDVCRALLGNEPRLK